MKKNDVFIIAAAVLLAAAVWLLTNGIRQKDSGGEVVVYKDGEVFYAGPIGTDTTITVEDELGNINVVLVKDGKAIMQKANCRDQICVNTRPAEKDGQAIICLPNKVSVEVRNTGTKDLDGVSE
ncbi:MAG: NusG domain II-containing protein [Clostridiaceae bacterium]|nr:NusG domain II-containing protein [Clostridiaceae bacterium]